MIFPIFIIVLANESTQIPVYQKIHLSDQRFYG